MKGNLVISKIDYLGPHKIPITGQIGENYSIVINITVSSQQIKQNTPDENYLPSKKEDK